MRLLTTTVTQHTGKDINNKLILSLLYAIKICQGDWGSEIRMSSQTPNKGKTLKPLKSLETSLEIIKHVKLLVRAATAQ